MIRNQIVEKCHSRTLKQKLLQQESLDLSKTMKIVRSEETTSQEALLLSNGSKENPIRIDHMAYGSKPSKTPPKLHMCYQHSGTDGHNATKCGAINSRCNSCKKVGLLQKVVRGRALLSTLVRRYASHSCSFEKCSQYASTGTLVSCSPLSNAST